jgi:hypothetical protein
MAPQVYFIVDFDFEPISSIHKQVIVISRIVAVLCPIQEGKLGKKVQVKLVSHTVWIKLII